MQSPNSSGSPFTGAAVDAKGSSLINLLSLLLAGGQSIRAEGNALVLDNSDLGSIGDSIVARINHGGIFQIENADNSKSTSISAGGTIRTNTTGLALAPNGYGILNVFNGNVKCGIWSASTYQLMTAMADPTVINASTAGIFSKDQSDANSANVVTIDEDKVVSENSGKVLSRTITHADTTVYNLYSTGTTEGLRIPTDCVCAFDILITCASSGLGVVGAWEVRDVITNDGGTTSFPAGAPTVNSLHNNDAALVVAVAADNVNNRLQITAQDSSGDAGQLKWKAVVRMNILQHTA